ncbi:MAG: PAS domain S-box protein [Anaerolineae bacterium]|nr:PAS domain S-box protein [Anaerolineae bacterium]
MPPWDLPWDPGLILDNCCQALAVRTPEGKILYANPAFCALTGYSPEELPSVDWAADLTPPEWRDLLARAVQELHRTGRPQRHEQECIRKDGSRVPIEVLLHEVLDEHGQVAYSYAFVTDISERKQTEALRQSELLYRTVAESSHDWEMWVGPEDYSFYCSPSSVRLSGYGPKEFEADRGLLRRIIHPDDLARFDEHEVANHRRAIEFRIRTRFGEERWIEHVCQSIYADDGTYLGRRSTNRDITDRVQAERERDRLLKEVENLARFPSENPDPVMRIDAEGVLLYANQAAAMLGGREVPGPGQSVPWAWRRAIDQALTTGKKVDLELRAGDRIHWLQFVPVATEGYVNVYSRDVTAQRHAEHERERLLEENRRQRAFLEAVLDSIADAILVHDPEGRIVLLNSAAQSLLQYSPEQLSQTYRERIATRLLVREDGQPYSLEQLPVARALRGETVRSELLGLGQPDGDIRWLICSAAPVLASEGRPLGAVVVLADITEMRRTQERLEEARALAERAVQEAERRAAELDAVFATIPTGVIVYGPDGRIVRMNGVAARFTPYPHQGEGLSAQERAKIYRFVRDDGTDLPLQEWPAEKALRGELVQEEVIGRLSPDGQTFWSVTSAAPIRSGDGAVLGAVLAFHDVSELRRAREALQEANEELAAANEELQVQAEELAVQMEELTAQRDQLERLTGELDLERGRLRAIVENAPMAVVVADERARVVMANRRAEELYVRPVPYGKDFAAHASLNLCQPDGTPCDPRQLPLTRSALDGEVCRNVELAIVWPDGQRHDLLMATAPVRDASGRVTGAVGVFEDITSLKDVERERENLERSKDQFLSVISHELRTPLASIMGYSELLLTGLVHGHDDVHREFLQVIFDSSVRLNLLIDDLLDLTRLDQRTFQLMLEPVRLDRLAEQTLELMKPMAQEKQQLLELELESDLPVLTGDSQRLGQVLSNLIGNAIKFSPNGASIKLRCWGTGDEVHIEVSDRGIGIAPEDMPHIFERFYRGTNAGRASGTGLGLYIAREIVEAHGGCIEVESRLGEGTTFRVRLPREQAGGE